ncbi:helix-turn-helix protein [compost metagenome]
MSPQVVRNNCVYTSLNGVFIASLVRLLVGILSPMKGKGPHKRNPIATSLGQRLKACRITAEKSQETLAFEALVDRTYISAMERGVANPSVETLANICYSLGITLAELFEPLTISLKPTGTRRSNTAEPEDIKRQRLR